MVQQRLAMGRGRSRSRYISGSPLRQRQALRHAIESLEPRRLLTSIVVNSTADNVNDAVINGPTVTLREAINFENANGGGSITFDPTLFAAPQKTITLTLGTLTLNTSVAITINGPSAGVTIDGNDKSTVFLVDAGTTATLTGLTIINGKGSQGMSSTDGGGIDNAGILTVSGSGLSNDNAPGGVGGGIENTGTLTVTGSTISGGTSDQGGGIDNYTGTLTVIDSTFSSNTADNAGGGINNASGSTLTVSNSTLANNTGFGIGAGINNSGTAFISDSTISGNSKGQGGFGDGIVNQATMTLNGNIVAGNSNSDLLGNFASSSSYNIIRDGSGGLLAANHNILGSTANPINVLLAQLGNYGGPTKTMALLPGSPALDAGATFSNVQDVMLSGGTAGTTQFTLTFNQQTTGAITFTGNAAADSMAVQSALNMLTSIGGAGGTVLSAPIAGGWQVTFGGSLAGTEPGLLGASVISGSGALSVSANTTDQRAVARPQGSAPDIGAFESQGFTVSATSGSPQSAGINISFANPLVATVSANDPGLTNLTGGLVTFAAPSTSASATLGSTSATIDANNQAQTTAAANSVEGQYSVTASAASGISTPGSFSLTNFGVATHLSIANSVVTAGKPFSVTVTALDAANDPAMGYRGTIHFSTSDTQAGVTLPADYTFAPSDDGVHTFINGVTLVTAGSQTITATDTTFSSITGTGSATVSAASASRVVLSNVANVTAGTPFSVTVTALDPFNNTATSYGGTIHFTSTDTRSGVALPADYTFVPGDDGVHTLANGVTLVTAGNQTITATDTSTSSITGTSSTITVSPAGATTVVVSGFPAADTAGDSHAFTVSLFDPFDNLATGYRGTITLSSSDAQAAFPVPTYTFLPGDAGDHTFVATLKTAGTQSITVTDSADSLTGSQTGIVVSPSVATKLAFGVPPSNTAAGVTIAPAVTVNVEDAYGNVETNDNADQVSLAIATGPGTFSATSTTTATAASGVATFGNLAIAPVGAYTLTASASGLTSVTSNPFAIIDNSAPIFVDFNNSTDLSSKFAVTPYGGTVNNLGWSPTAGIADQPGPSAGGGVTSSGANTNLTAAYTPSSVDLSDGAVHTISQFVTWNSALASTDEPLQLGFLAPGTASFAGGSESFISARINGNNTADIQTANGGTTSSVGNTSFARPANGDWLQLVFTVQETAPGAFNGTFSVVDYGKTAAVGNVSVASQPKVLVQAIPYSVAGLDGLGIGTSDSPGFRFATSGPIAESLDDFSVDPVTTITDDQTTGAGNDQVSYSPGWTTSSLAGAYDSTYSSASNAGASATVNFSGTQIRYYAVTAPTFGSASVSVDGGPATLINETTSAKTGDVLVYSSPILTPGVHTLTISIIGHSTGHAIAISVDRFDIIKATPAVRWPSPASITTGTPLSSSQLDATTNVAGTFVYAPPAGTVLSNGPNQTLSAVFIPADTADYGTVALSTQIGVFNLPPGITPSIGAVYVYNPAADTLALTSGTLTFSQDLGGSFGLSVTASGAGSSLVFQTSQHLAGLTLTGGAIATDQSLGVNRTHSNHSVLVIGTLGAVSDPTFSIDSANGSKLDMMDNDLIVHTGSSDATGAMELAAVQALAATGRNVAPGGVFDGTWDGDGLTSSSAATVDAGVGFEQNVLAVELYSDMFLGEPNNAWTVGSFNEPLGAHDIIVKDTYDGDLALDGAVDGNAATIFSSYFNNGATVQNDYAFGDLNGDGKVNGNDATIFSSLFDYGMPVSGLPLL